MFPSFSELWRMALEVTTPLLVYQITVSVFVALSLINAIADGFTFRRPTVEKGNGPSPGARTGTEAYPSLSVLIPARNEEAVIAACVQSLQAQKYPGVLQILVLDDRSTDRTGEIVQAIAEQDARVRLLRGGDLLPGWKGKPNALRQLATAATGEILLLTDADCLFEPDALLTAVHYRASARTDCLSLIPNLLSGSFWEHVVIPLQYMLVFLTLPVRNIYATPNPAFAAANGAFILIPAATYTALGGHESVKGEMAEDIRFAQYVKKSGRKLIYADGSRIYKVRMYESLRGIWDGFSKNMFPAMGKSIPVLAAMLTFLLISQVLPFLFVLVAVVTGDRSLAGFWLPLAHGIVSLGIRIGVCLRFRQALWATFLQPIGWCIVIAIGINSAYQSLSGKGHTWKGRVYQT